MPGLSEQRASVGVLRVVIHAFIGAPFRPISGGVVIAATIEVGGIHRMREDRVPVVQSIHVNPLQGELHLKLRANGSKALKQGASMLKQTRFHCVDAGALREIHE
jgi:hypothetical protein